jgi:hypothetical protein
MEALQQEAARMSESFKQIGAFVFQFSQLEFTVRVVLGGMLRLTDEQFDVVTAPYDFLMLCSVTKVILKRKYAHKAQHIDDIFKRCSALNDDRVRVAHGLWSDNLTHLTARHVARHSLTARHFFENPDDLARLTDAGRQLMAELIELTRADTTDTRDDATT